MKAAAYSQSLAASGGTGPYTWALAGASTLPSGLSLSTDGIISGTLANSVSAGNYNFTVQVTDSASASTATNKLDTYFDNTAAGILTVMPIAVALMSLLVGWLALPETKDNDINA